MTHWIVLEPSGEGFGCGAERSVLRAMEALGRRGIPVGCREGGCGVCKLQVLRGDYQTRRMSRGVLSPQEEAEGVVLACRLYPKTDLLVKPVQHMDNLLRRASAAERQAQSAASGQNQKHSEEKKTWQ